MVGGKGWGWRLFGALIALAIFASSAPASAAAQTEPGGFDIVDGRLIDGYGNDFVMRGVNHPHAWFESEIGALADIKATGANAVRIVLSTGARFSRTSPQVVSTLVQRCQSLRLVCVLEVHDTTGYPGVADSISLDQAADYWDEMFPVLAGTESFILVNIGNEPFDNETTDSWRGDTEAAIRRLRERGYMHTLMVDAPNWGQDWTFTMRDQAAAVLASDPQNNLMFDIHMYGVFDDAIKVRTYLESFVRRGLPLVIGEFGATHPDGDPAERAMLHWAALYGVGTLAWSWSGNVDPVPDLNIVEDFDPERRTPWGEIVLAGAPGVRSEPLEASIFGEPIAWPRPLLAQPPSVAQPQNNLVEPIQVTRVEAEHGIRNGLSVAVDGAGYSGAGYLHGSDTFGDSVTVTVNVDHSGTYELVAGYRAPYGDKLQSVIINGTDRDTGSFPQSDQFTSTTVAAVRLRAGSNTITIQHYWGWIDLDYIEVWTGQ